MYERQAYPDAQGPPGVLGRAAVGSTGGGKGLIEQHTARRTGGRDRDPLRRPRPDLVVEDGRVSRRHLETRQVPPALSPSSCSPPVDSRPMPLGAQPNSARDGDGPRCAARPSIPATCSTRALTAGAARYGDWTTCHSVAWDAWFPDNESNRELTNQLTRGGYPLGIVVNLQGERFLDEGRTSATTPTPSTAPASSTSRTGLRSSSSTPTPGRG